MTDRERPNEDGLGARRKGLAAAFPFAVQGAATESASVTIRIEHRDGADESWTTLASVGPMQKGHATAFVTGVKERYRVTVDVHGSVPGESFRVLSLPPVWRSS